MPYVTTPLGRWFYDEVGRKKNDRDPDIVLCHSLLCDGGMWRGQVGPLSELGRVIVIDQPGHGRSEVPPPFTLEEHVHALTESWDRLSIERAVLVGLSWGGMLGMRMAVTHRNRLAGMALLDTSADEPVLREKIEYRALVEVERRIGLPPRLVEKRIVPLMFSPKTIRERAELVTEFVRGVEGYPREGLARAAIAVSIQRRSVLDELRNISTPTLIGCGADDVATPPVHSRKMAARIPGSRLAMIEGVGHLSALEDPEQVNAHLVPFVRDHLVTGDAPFGGHPVRGDAPFGGHPAPTA